MNLVKFPSVRKAAMASLSLESIQTQRLAFEGSPAVEEGKLSVLLLNSSSITSVSFFLVPRKYLIPLKNQESNQGRPRCLKDWSPLKLAQTQRLGSYCTKKSWSLNDDSHYCKGDLLEKKHHHRC